MRIALLLLTCWWLGAQTYPPARRSDTVDTLHGQKVADPYRYMEDVDSAETRTWVQQEVAHTNQWFAQLPSREPIRARLTALTQYTQASLPIVSRGSRLFYQRRATNQNQPVLYLEEKGMAHPILDPNTLSANGTVALSYWKVSPDGNRIAYGIAKAGSDWVDILVRNVETGTDLPDRVEWTKFNSPAWAADSKAFYYAAFPAPAAGSALTTRALGQRVFLHRLGDKPAQDTLVYERPDHPDWLYSAWVSPDGKALALRVRQASTGNALYFRDLSRPNSPIVPLVDKFDSVNEVLGMNEGRLLVRSSANAPKGRIIAIDPQQPETQKWRIVLPEQKDTLEDAELAAGRIFSSYMVDVKAALRVYRLNGQLEHEVALPGPGVAHWSEADPTDTTAFYSFESPLSPTALYRYDSTAKKATPFFVPQSTFDPKQFETIQVFYPSKDGTRIPMFLSYKKGFTRNAANPTLLYGYGGFNLNSRPTFSPYTLAWMEMGGVYAVANLRGGGEYGEAWHLAGTKQNKQNVFDDFIAAAEWLIAEKYTTSKKLSILGASNGGLLVAACLNQRPELFGAAVPKVGVMDMLRFHKFTIGRAWTGDYGNPDNSEDFAAIAKYSPIHNIKRGTVFPPTLITTADHDDRVVPAHSFKYAATMQYSQEGKAPILIRIETDAGHGGGKPVSKQIDEWADTFAFLRQALNMGPAK